MNILRIKITDKCSLSCCFCHNEGILVNDSNQSRRVSIFSNVSRMIMPGEMKPDEDFLNLMEKIRRSFHIDTVHLTGGEPMQSEYVFEFIEKLKELDYKVKMTSNGDYEIDVLKKALSKGLDRVVISFSGDFEDFAKTQIDKTNLVKHFRNIQNTVEYVCSNKINAALNVVVNGGDEEKITRIIKDYSSRIQIKLLRNLSCDESLAVINRVLSCMNAEKIGSIIKPQSSDVRMFYKIGGNVLTVKDINKKKRSYCKNVHSLITAKKVCMDFVYIKT